MSVNYKPYSATITLSEDKSQFIFQDILRCNVEKHFDVFSWFRNQVPGVEKSLCGYESFVAAAYNLASRGSVSLPRIGSRQEGDWHYLGVIHLQELFNQVFYLFWIQDEGRLWISILAGMQHCCVAYLVLPEEGIIIQRHNVHTEYSERIYDRSLVVLKSRAPKLGGSSDTSSQNSGRHQRGFKILLKEKNIAHHIMNELSFLEAFRYSSRFPLEIYTCNQFFGPIELLFPEYKCLKIIYMDSQLELIRSFMDSPLPAIPVGRQYVSLGLRARILETASRLGDQASDSHPKGLSELQKSKWPIVVFSIRSSGRKWINQVEGIREICMEILHRYKGLTCIIDGFTWLPSCDPSQPLDKHLQLDFDLAKKVSTELSVFPGINIVDLVGMQISHAIQIISHADYYISHFGTAHLKIMWFSLARGLVHGHSDVIDRYFRVHPVDVICLEGSKCVPDYVSSRDYFQEPGSDRMKGDFPYILESQAIIRKIDWNSINLSVSQREALIS